MKLSKKVTRNNRRSSSYIMARAMMALASLLSLALVSGAGSHWH